MTSGWETLTFWLFFAMAILPAVGVLFVREIVRIATLLLVTFSGLAGFYLLLGADFIAVIQVLVYIGGILILLLFGVMLTSKEPVLIKRTKERHLVGPGLLVAGLAFCGLFLVAFNTGWYRVQIPLPEGSPPVAVSDLPVEESGVRLEALHRDGTLLPVDAETTLRPGDELEVVANTAQLDRLQANLSEAAVLEAIPEETRPDLRTTTREPAVLVFRVGREDAETEDDEPGPGTVALPFERELVLRATGSGAVSDRPDELPEDGLAVEKHDAVIRIETGEHDVEGESETVAVSAPRPGRITEVLVAAADEVEAGAPVARMTVPLTVGAFEDRHHIVVPDSPHDYGDRVSAVRVVDLYRPRDGGSPEAPAWRAVYDPGYRPLRPPFLDPDLALEEGDLVRVAGPEWAADRVRRDLDLSLDALSISPSATSRSIGSLLMTDYILPFEIASVLLLAALVGAAFIARRKGASS